MFIRQDLPLAQQLVQSNHATFKLASGLQPEGGIPNIVVIGVPDVRALSRVLAKLKQHQIVHAPFYEPDFDYGFTAIATAPLNEVSRQVLSNYRLYSGGTGKPVCQVKLDPGANADVAQAKSTELLARRSLNGKPAIGSI